MKLEGLGFRFKGLGLRSFFSLIHRAARISASGFFQGLLSGVALGVGLRDRRASG